MGSPPAQSDSTLSGPQGQIQGHSDFEVLYLIKVAELAHMVLLNTNRKSYIGNSFASSDLTLNVFERSNSRPATF